MDLVAVLSKRRRIILDGRRLQHLHPPLNPAKESVALVPVEVIAGYGTHRARDLSEHGRHLFRDHAFGGRAQGFETANVKRDLGRNLFERQQEIDGSRRASRALLRGVGLAVQRLGDRQPAILLGRADAGGAVATQTCKDYGDRMVMCMLGNRDQQCVHGAAIGDGFLGRTGCDVAVGDSDDLIAAADVNAAGLKPFAILRLPYGKLRLLGQRLDDRIDGEAVLLPDRDHISGVQSVVHPGEKGKQRAK